MLDAADRGGTAAGLPWAVADTLCESGLHGPDDYAIPLPEWLRRCIEHVPPGRGDSLSLIHI